MIPVFAENYQEPSGPLSICLLANFLWLLEIGMFHVSLLCSPHDRCPTGCRRRAQASVTCWRRPGIHMQPPRWHHSNCTYLFECLTIAFPTALIQSSFSCKHASWLICGLRALVVTTLGCALSGIWLCPAQEAKKGDVLSFQAWKLTPHLDCLSDEEHAVFGGGEFKSMRLVENVLCTFYRQAFVHLRKTHSHKLWQL